MFLLPSNFYELSWLLLCSSQLDISSIGIPSFLPVEFLLSLVLPERSVATQPSPLIDIFLKIFLKWSNIEGLREKPYNGKYNHWRRGCAKGTRLKGELDSFGIQLGRNVGDPIEAYRVGKERLWRDTNG